MRMLWVGLAAALAVSSAPAGAQQSAPADTFTNLVGTWSCRSETGSNGVDLFTRNADGSISNTIRYSFTAPAPGGEFDAVYRYDPATSQWSWSSTTPSDTSFIEKAVQTQATADVAVFEGSEDTIEPAGAAAPERTHLAIRLVYTFLSPNQFQREFEARQNGLWRPYSSTVCQRATGAPAGAAS